MLTYLQNFSLYCLYATESMLPGVLRPSQLQPDALYISMQQNTFLMHAATHFWPACNNTLFISMQQHTFDQHAATHRSY